MLAGNGSAKVGRIQRVARLEAVAHDEQLGSTDDSVAAGAVEVVESERAFANVGYAAVLTPT